MELVERITTHLGHYRYWVVVTLILILAVILRFFMISEQSLWIDEGWSLFFSDGLTLGENLTRVIYSNTNDKFQSLYFVLLYFWRHGLGDSEWSLRALSAIFGIGAVVFLFLSSLQVYGKRHALWSLIIGSCSSFAVYYSQEVRTYSFLLFLASLQIYLFFRSINGGGSGNPHKAKVLFVICTIIGFMSSIFLIVFTVSLSGAHLLAYRKLRNWKKFWLPVFLFTAPITIFYCFALAITPPSMTPYHRSSEPIFYNLVFVLYSLTVGQTYGPSVEILHYGGKSQVLMESWPKLLILAGLGVTMLLLFLRTMKKGAGKDYRSVDYFLVLNFAIGCILSIIFAFVSKINWLPRHSCFLFVPMAMLIPITAREIPNSKPRFKNLGGIVICLLIFLNLFSLNNYFFSNEHRRDDYRSVADYLKSEVSSRAVLLWGLPDLFKYYGAVNLLDGRGLPKDDLDRGIQEITSGAQRIIIVINREFYWGEPHLLQELLKASYQLESERKYPYFHLYTFLKRDNPNYRKD